MKAWKVIDIKGDGYCTVVFAETRGKAHYIAMTTDCCEDAEWNDVRVTRVPALDSAYRGYSVMAFYDPIDRVELVKAGFHCEYIDIGDCEECAAKNYCDAYTDYLADLQRERFHY